MSDKNIPLCVSTLADTLAGEEGLSPATAQTLLLEFRDHCVAEAVKRTKDDLSALLDRVAKAFYSQAQEPPPVAPSGAAHEARERLRRALKTDGILAAWHATKPGFATLGDEIKEVYSAAEALLALPASPPAAPAGGDAAAGALRELRDWADDAVAGDASHDAGLREDEFTNGAHRMKDHIVMEIERRIAALGGAQPGRAT